MPEEIRAQAVGEYRRDYMRGSSKSARRKMTYQRLRTNPTYLHIERGLLEAHYARHATSGMANVDSMTLAQVGEAYRALGQSRVDPALDQFALEACKSICAERKTAQGVYEDLSHYICRLAQTQDLSACAHVADPSARASGRRQGIAFHIQDLATPEEVAHRVRVTHLVEGIVRRAYDQRDIPTVVARLMTGRLEKDAELSALAGLMDGLYGSMHQLDASLTLAVRPHANRITRQLVSREFAVRITEALLQNPIYRKQFERAVEIKLRVRENVPETPMEAYPLARTMTRHVVLHVGPSNSGKTHDALQALMAAESGAYLGPLRLLAYEQFELMNREGCPCTLLTGEECTEVAGARHVSSTVEMANFHNEVDVAVIDEAQMIADPDRGHNWTAAILGMPAHELHICCAPHAARIVRELVALCGDTIETVWHQRLVPLQADRGAFRLPVDVRPGDALIVFSRRAVHAVAAQVQAMGLKASLVYGALPHDVRHEEARRFDAGETDVVVATDAIGMGMNLPIRRIVFVEQEKYDGHCMRLLKAEEVQQIAGRAGRYGRYNKGFYQSTKLRHLVRELYDQEVGPITSIPVGIPDDIALVRDATLTESILQWKALEQPEPFVRIDVTRDLMLIGEVERRLDPELLADPATKHMILALATMAFDERDDTLREAWGQMVDAELAGKEAELRVPEAPRVGMRLVDLEVSYRYCDLLYTYARTFNHPERMELLGHRRAQISHVIMAMLAQAATDEARPRQEQSRADGPQDSGKAPSRD